MAISDARPMRFTPRGLVDAFDATDEFPGACQRITNLIFDQSNPELVIARPGTDILADFTEGGFNTPTFVSVHAVIGPRVYGMVTTQRYPGHDEPFCWDTTTDLFVPIANVIAGNTPTSPDTTGDWSPPTIASVGVMVLVTHPGFNGTGANYFGLIDATNPNALTWAAVTTATNPLPYVPVAVANYNNRAWFALKNQLWYTDVLTNPPTITNATQFLVLGDTSPLNALNGLPVSTTSSGIVAALIAFKQTQVWQITGDTTTMDLAENFISLTVGTNSPRSVAQSTLGIYFASTGGPYYIDPLGTLRPLTASAQSAYPDIVAPFQNATDPTRWASTYNSSIYRVCGETVIRGEQATRDYWFDERKRRWNGPHTFPYDCASALAGYFVLSSYLNPGLLLRSAPFQSPGIGFTDLDIEYNCDLLSSTFPKVNDQMQKQVAESTIELGARLGNVIYTVTAQDEQGFTLGTVRMGGVQDGALWNSNVWNDGTRWAVSEIWGGGELWGAPIQGGSGAIWENGHQIPSTYPVYWVTPLVFDKMQLEVEAVASEQVVIGTFYARYQQTGYQAWRSIDLARCTPGVTIEKYTNGVRADDPNAAGVPNLDAGDDITWTYKITNTGNTSIARSEVIVTDNQPGVVPSFLSELSGNGDAMFDPGDIWLYVAAGTALDLTVPPPAGTHTVPNVCTAGGTQAARTAYYNTATVTLPGITATSSSSYCNNLPPDVAALASGILLLDTMGLYLHTSGSGLGSLMTPANFTDYSFQYQAQIKATSPAASQDSGLLGPASSINHGQYCSDVATFCTTDSRTNTNDVFGIFSSKTPTPNDPTDPSFAYSDQKCGGEVLGTIASPTVPTAQMKGGAASNILQPLSPAFTGTATANNYLVVTLSIATPATPFDINFNATSYLEAFLSAAGISEATATMQCEFQIIGPSGLIFDWSPNGTTGSIPGGGTSLLCPFTLNTTVDVTAPTSGASFAGSSLASSNTGRFKAAVPTFNADVIYTLIVATTVTISAKVSS